MCFFHLQKCFFRQFFNSVAKVDYLTLRHAFIAVIIYIYIYIYSLFGFFL